MGFELLFLDELTLIERCDLASATIDPTVLKQLSDDPDWYVRRLVALNPKTPVDVLIAISSDSHAPVAALARSLVPLNYRSLLAYFARNREARVLVVRSGMEEYEARLLSGLTYVPDDGRFISNIFRNLFAIEIDDTLPDPGWELRALDGV